ncbi:MAG: glycosyltransferase, partial [bacterium]
MARELQDLRVAVVTDWLTNRGGGERVVLLLAEMFPQADLYTSVFKSEAFPELSSRRVFTSHLQKSPLRYRHQLFSAARPAAFEAFNLDNYDLVISSTSAEAKGVLTKPETPHICYCYTPTRYYWSHYHEYLKDWQFGWLNPIVKPLLPALIHKLRLWDRIAADRVDYFIGISKHVQKRIAKYYETGSALIYPPVDTSRFRDLAVSDGGFYLIVGRQVAYKRTNLAVEAFNRLGKPLKVIGEGPEIDKLKRLATSSAIEFLGYLPDDQVARHIGQCRALIFPQEEDFGIVPLEAMAAGKPVIAYGVGGAAETVVDGETGVWFAEQTPESLSGAIERFEQLTISPEACRAQAAKFDNEVFKKEFLAFVKKTVEE